MRTEPSKEQNLVNKLSSKPSLIRWIEERLERDDRLGINIGSEEGLILKALCSQPHIKKVVEIGTQYGCSASWMAMGLGTRGLIHCFEKDPLVAGEAEETFGHSDFKALGCEVRLHKGAALEKLPAVEGEGPFDLVFIDANKAGYLDYFNWAKANTRVGGLIVVDNVYLFGTVFLDECPDGTPKKMWNVMRELLAQAFEDPKLSSSLIPTQEGLLVSCKKS